MRRENKFGNINSALSEIEFFRRQLFQTGAADDENSAINRVVEALQAGTIDPDEAIKRVRSIATERSSFYH